MSTFNFKFFSFLLILFAAFLVEEISSQDVGKACWIHEVVCARELGIRDFPQKKPTTLTQTYCCNEAHLAKCYLHKLTIDANCKSQTNLVPAADPNCAKFTC